MGPQRRERPGALLHPDMHNLSAPSTEGELEIRETQEHIEHAHHEKNKRAAILIIVLAVALAIIEMASKEAQFSSISHNIDVSDLYAFYQAKTVRSTVLRTAVENAEAAGDADEIADRRRNQISTWKSTIDRLDSEPATGEGRKELLLRAKGLEEQRDHEVRAYHAYEFASAGLELAIVMASAAVITEVTLLEGIAIILGLCALALGGIGWLSPTLLPL